MYYIKSNEDSFFKIKEKAIIAKIPYTLNIEFIFCLMLYQKEKILKLASKSLAKIKKKQLF